MHYLQLKIIVSDLMTGRDLELVADEKFRAGGDAHSFSAYTSDYELTVNAL